MLMPGYYRMILFLEKKKHFVRVLLLKGNISKFQIVNKTGVIVLIAYDFFI